MKNNRDRRDQSQRTQRRGILNSIVRQVSLSRIGVTWTKLRKPGLYRHVRCFCLFVGHGRSGSSLVGALLNAHPNVVMSNEVGILDFLAEGRVRDQLFNMIYHVSSRQARRGSAGGGGYSYAVPGQWQGMHEQIQVIGDRKAGATAIRLYRCPRLLDRLQKIVNTPVLFVSVVRNPYDTLTTTLRKTVRLDGETQDQHLERQIDHYFERTEAIRALVERLGRQAVKFVHHDELLVSPASVLTELCGFLGIDTPRDYLESCATIIHPSAHVTRTEINWPGPLIERVQRESERFFWLKQYSFSR